MALGMSGGVDSSAAAILLKDKGYNVSGITLKLFGNADSDAKAVCRRLNIPHTFVDLTEEFKNTVIENFISEYIKARTPNPCVLCNEKIKFGKMLFYALDGGFDLIATGHYARLKNIDGRTLLLKAKDLTKDQSYYLYGLNQFMLSHTLFPLGELTKAESRKLAEENGLLNAKKKDSQDICFVPDGEYAKFITEFSGFVSNQGNFTDLSGNILGRHKGIINYTVGQRKGLGIALGKPAFVISKNAGKNTVTLGDEENLFYKRVLVKDINYIPFDGLKSDMPVKAKLRYRQTEQSAVLHPISENETVIEFNEPQRAPASGQSAVFYDGDVVIGGGIIEKGM